MNDNNVYNLMTQSVQEHKSLWRILNDYREDAEGDEELAAFWEQLATEKGAQLALLEDFLASRLAMQNDRDDSESQEVAPDAAPQA